MSESLGGGVMTFGGDDRDFQKVADNVERRMKQVAANFSGSSFAFTNPNYKNVVVGLDDVSKGAERASQGLLRLGRTYYFTRVADGLRDMAQAAEKFTVEIAKGNARVEDLVEAMAKKLPFGIGALVEVGRDVHGFLTGDTVAIAQSQADAAAAEKKIDFQNRLELAVRKVGRAAEDQHQKLNFTVGNSPFLDSIETILKRGERAAEDQRTELATNQSLLDEGGKRRQTLLQQLEDIKAKPDIVHATDPGEATTFIPRSGEIADAQKAIDKLDQQLQKYRDTIGQIDATLNSETGNAGRPTFTGIFNLIGAEAEKGLGQASGAIDRFLGRIPELTKATQRLVDNFSATQQARAGNIGQFQTEQSALGIDLSRGLLNPDQFKQLTDKSRFDQFTRSLQSMFQQYAPIVEMIGRITDANIGGPFRKIFGALGQLPGLAPGRVAEPKAFQSSFVGLTDLGNRIQSAAASGKGDETLNKIADNTTLTNRLTQKVIDAFKGLSTLGTVK